MSSRSGRKTADGQRLPLRLAALCVGSTPALNLGAAHPANVLRSALDTTFGLVSRGHRNDATARDLTVDGAPGVQVPARLYEPPGVGDDAPLLVLYHGGGWVVGSLDSHANSCKFLARAAGCKVLAVGYRKAPEYPFPAAQEDSIGAFRWARDHAEELGIDPARIAVGGDSAGGNLAAAVCLGLTDDEATPAFALLIYPLVDADLASYESYHLFHAGPLLSGSATGAMLDHYAPRGVDRSDPRLSVIHSDRIAHMPPTYIATAGMDILRDQGERFGDVLAAAGIEVEVRRFDNLPHGFDVLLIDPDCRRATEAVAAALADGLAAT